MSYSNANFKIKCSASRLDELALMHVCQGVKIDLSRYPFRGEREL